MYNWKQKRKSVADQQSTNKRESKVIGYLLKQPDTQRNATTISTGYTPKISPLKIDTMTEK